MERESCEIGWIVRERVELLNWVVRGDVGVYGLRVG